jgi:hypothetical protein
MPNFLHHLTLLAIAAPNVLGSKFEWHRCDCDASGTIAVAELLNVKFILPNGREAGVSGNVQCNTIGGRPDACSAWPLLNHCVDTGICGVGLICYDQEVFTSDKFSVNGRTYKKNSYTHRYLDLRGSDACKSLCEVYGWKIMSSGSAAYGQVIEGWGPEPTACS